MRWDYYYYYFIIIIIIIIIISTILIQLLWIRADRKEKSILTAAS